MNKTSHKKNRPFDFKLIDLVEPHPVIYMRHIPGMSAFKMMKAKNNIWQQIAKQMKQNVRFCLSRWNNLRGQFQKELRHFNKLCPKSGVLRHSTWPYLQRLRFLESTIQFNKPKKLSTSKRRKRREFLMMDDYADHNTTVANTLNTIDSCDEDGNGDGNHFLRVTDSAEASADANCNHMAIEGRNADDQVHYEEKCINVDANNSKYLEVQASTKEQSEIVQDICADEDDYHLVEYLEDDTGCHLKEEEILGIDCLMQTDDRISSSANCLTNLHTIQTLLMAFDNENRHHIERRILAFLCKCQLRLLINCDINDLSI